LPVLGPLEAFLVGYALVVVLSSRRVKVYLSLLAMIVVFGLLALTPGAVGRSVVELGEWNNLRVFVYIFFSMLLAGVMREQGRLEGLVESTSMAGCRFSLLSVPALIGLMPMPGGALVSAIALRRKYFEEARLSREDATYLNYWFRHVWVPVWPLFQSVVITAAVLGVGPLDIVSHTWPASVGAIIGGLAVAYYILSRVECPRHEGEGGARLFLWSFWPLLLLALLFVAVKTVPALRRLPGFNADPMLASLIVVAATTLASKPLPLEKLRRALSLAVRPTIHLVLLESLLLKDMVVNSGAGAETARLVSTGLIPGLALVFAIPFILGLAAGGENFFASTAIPLLTGIIGVGARVDWWPLTVAYTGGYLGVMMSPIHLCLALTVEYYESRLLPVLAKVLVSVVITALVGLALAKIIL